MEHPLSDYRSRPAGATHGILLALALWAGFADSAFALDPICGHRVMLAEAIDPGLSDSERRLVCGDPRPESANTEALVFDDAWKRVPPSQAEFNLRNFLQERGYFNPLFHLNDGRMLVNAGEPTRVSRFEVIGGPEGFKPERRRKLLGEVMTPGLLSATEKWVEQRVRALGYPCPRFRTEGAPDTGVVRVHVEAGPQMDLVEVLEHDLPGIRPEILRRYDAFQLGERFDEDLLAVTESRVMNLGLFQNIHFASSCAKTGAVVRQDVVAGPPRLVRFGLGFDTEDGIKFRASWRNTRLGARASWLDISLLVSNREQLIDISSNWYLLPDPSRKSLRPGFQLTHDNEIHYEIVEAKAQLAFSTTYDSQVVALRFLSGPSFDRVQTLSGIGPAVSDLTSWDTRLQATSHRYEYFLTSPRSGWDTIVGSSFNAKGVGSSVTAQRLGWSGHALWNWSNFDPPLLVLGTRFGLRTVVAGEGLSALPPNIRQYLGGSENLRGFGRQELPNEIGALTSGWVSLEIRLAATMPASLEPVVFFDAGALGNRPFDLDEPLYWSPGIGLRWPSPVGVFRGTAARGFATGLSGHWQFYLSFGEEF